MTLKNGKLDFKLCELFTRFPGLKTEKVLIAKVTTFKGYLHNAAVFPVDDGSNFP